MKKCPKCFMNNKSNEVICECGHIFDDKNIWEKIEENKITKTLVWMFISTDGRANIFQMWMFVLIYIVLFVIITLSIDKLIDPFPMLYVGIRLIITFIKLVFGIPMIIKRMQDLNLRWYHLILLFVPLVNILFFIILLTVPGRSLRNRYGDRRTGILI